MVNLWATNLEDQRKCRKMGSWSSVTNGRVGKCVGGGILLTTWPRRRRYHGVELWWVVLFVVTLIFEKNLIGSECHSSIWRSLNTVWCWECNGMVFVLFCCRRNCKKTSKKKRVSHVFALKIFLREERKSVAVQLCITVVCYLKDKKSRLRYVNVWCALLLVDYWKNLRRHVSVVRLRVFVKVVFGIMVVGEKIMSCHTDRRLHCFVYLCRGEGAETWIVSY